MVYWLKLCVILTKENDLNVFIKELFMKKIKSFLKNYKTILALILAMIIGAICGLIFKEDAMVVKPLGDLFLNLMFVIIVPLIFLTISLAVAKVKQPKRLGKIMGTTVIVFIIFHVSLHHLKKSS